MPISTITPTTRVEALSSIERAISDNSGVIRTFLTTASNRAQGIDNIRARQESDFLGEQQSNIRNEFAEEVDRRNRVEFLANLGNNINQFNRSNNLQRDRLGLDRERFTADETQRDFSNAITSRITDNTLTTSKLNRDIAVDQNDRAERSTNESIDSSRASTTDRARRTTIAENAETRLSDKVDRDLASKELSEKAAGEFREGLSQIQGIDKFENPQEYQDKVNEIAGNISDPVLAAEFQQTFGINTGDASNDNSGPTGLSDAAKSRIDLLKAQRSEALKDKDQDRVNEIQSSIEAIQSGGDLPSLTPQVNPNPNPNPQGVNPNGDAVLSAAASEDDINLARNRFGSDFEGAPEGVRASMITQAKRAKNNTDANVEFAKQLAAEQEFATQITGGQFVTAEVENRNKPIGPKPIKDLQPQIIEAARKQILDEALGSVTAEEYDIIRSKKNKDRNANEKAIVRAVVRRANEITEAVKNERGKDSSEEDERASTAQKDQDVIIQGLLRGNN